MKYNTSLSMLEYFKQLEKAKLIMYFLAQLSHNNPVDTYHKSIFFEVWYGASYYGRMEFRGLTNFRKYYDKPLPDGAELIGYHKNTLFFGEANGAIVCGCFNHVAVDDGMNCPCCGWHRDDEKARMFGAQDTGPDILRHIFNNSAAANGSLMDQVATTCFVSGRSEAAVLKATGIGETEYKESVYNTTLNSMFGIEGDVRNSSSSSLTLNLGEFKDFCSSFPNEGSSVFGDMPLKDWASLLEEFKPSVFVVEVKLYPLNVEIVKLSTDSKELWETVFPLFMFSSVNNETPGAYCLGASGAPHSGVACTYRHHDLVRIPALNRYYPQLGNSTGYAWKIQQTVPTLAGGRLFAGSLVHAVALSTEGVLIVAAAGDSSITHEVQLPIFSSWIELRKED